MGDITPARIRELRVEGWNEALIIGELKCTSLIEKAKRLQVDLLACSEKCGVDTVFGHARVYQSLMVLPCLPVDFVNLVRDEAVGAFDRDLKFGMR
jgi:hypothetical protein